jgi:hypothetical protein
MNIQTVAENLRKTIAGKEQFQAKLREEADPSAHTKTLLGFLAINLTELRGILQDVEQCEPSLPGEGNNYEKWDGDE